MLLEYSRRSEKVQADQSYSGNENDEDLLQTIFDTKKSLNLKKIRKSIVEEVNSQIANL